MTKGLFRRYHGQLTSVRNEALDDKGFISVLEETLSLLASNCWPTTAYSSIDSNKRVSPM